MRRQIFRRSMMVFLCAILITPMLQYQTQAQAKESQETQVTQTLEIPTEQVQTYNNFIGSTDLKSYEGEDIQLPLDTQLELSYGEVGDIQVNAPEEALYDVFIDYATVSNNLLPAEMTIDINGERPFVELRRIAFESQWVADDETVRDRYGNEIAPIPYKVKDWQQKAIQDGSYRHTENLKLPLKAGDNTLTLRMTEGDIQIRAITLKAPVKLEAVTVTTVSGNNLITIEAEAIDSRNDSSIRATGEYNVSLTPYDATKRVLNILDGNAFKRAGQSVTYNFEVPVAGTYYLAYDYRQLDRIDYPVFIDIALNDHLQNAQLKNYPMPYNTNFSRLTVKDLQTQKPMAINLEAGLNTLTMTISVEPMTPGIEKVEAIIKEINALALEINKLTGSKSDKYRDFDLDEYIPGIGSMLIDWSERLDVIYSELAVHNEEADVIGAFSSLQIASKNLRTLSEKPDELPARMTEFANGTTSVIQYLANTVQLIDSNALAIDKIFFYQDEDSLPKKVNFFKRIFEAIKRFFYSFADQAYSVKQTNPDHLQVWVNRPRQYVEILQKMVDEGFSAETGIKVDLSIMPDQNKLILANAAGKSPDVAQSIHFALPHDLAIRGALEDLTQYDNYDDVIAPYPEGLVIPSIIENGNYAIPETMNFWVMYYRSDILSALNIPVPNTMKEVTEILPELQRRGMSFYYPSAGMPGIKYFAATMPLIYQHGGTFYDDFVGKTTINSEASLAGLKDLTDLFLIFNAPYDVPSFYQHFRDGKVPIGIAEYGMYNLLLNAAPEIANSWEIALFPGVEDESGVVQRQTAGAAESSVIFSNSDKKDAAWEYLTWWNSVETQVEFGYTLQTTYGKEFLWNTANMDAFSQLPWQSDHREVIVEQAKWMVEAPRVPGSYMLERELSNLYNAVVIDGRKLRTSVDNAVKRIDRETVRKLEEFGYMKEGQLIKPYPVPSLENLERKDN
jgi:ABC-type glycerol-3-phosphate transport system substrate-binding protein